MSEFKSELEINFSFFTYVYSSNEVKKILYIQRAKNRHVDPINQYVTVSRKKYSK